MMKTIKSSFFNIDKDDKLLYLNKCVVCHLPKENDLRAEALKREGAVFECAYQRKFDESVLVLEPHPDDFALSALAYTIGKYNASVLNVFTKTTLKYFPWIDRIKLNSSEYEKIRLEESHMVIEKILNQKFSSLMEKSMRLVNEKENAIEARILDAVKKELNSDEKLSIIMVPMGVGEHPDHLAVHDAMMNNYSEFNNYKIILYPEYPYLRSKKQYYNRMQFINEHYVIEPIVVDVEKYINIIVDCISGYKSQINDVNRDQMLAIVREDCWAVAQDYDTEKLSFVFYEVKGVKK